MQHYIYDAAGERVLKANSEVQEVYQNGTILDQTNVTISSYTTYPSAFIVIDPQGVYSKHYYAGSQRVVSRVGDQDISIFDSGCTTCKATQGKKVDDSAIRQIQIQDLQERLGKAKLGKAGFKKYASLNYEEAQKALQEDTDEGEESKAPILTVPILPIYYYHPDHLGTSTFLTDANGNAYQFFLNLPFGETMAEQRPSSYYATPYKFNGKELDEETGLYYYGARYYDARSSIWLSVDPLAEEFPNASPYNYCNDNPINLVDPDGMKGDAPGKGWTRFWGGLRAVGGVAQVVVGVVGGVATSWTGVGAVVGVVATVHGADDFQAGVRQLWTGEETESLTYKGLKTVSKAAGASDKTASRIATGGDIALGFVGGGGSATSIVKASRTSKSVQFLSKFCFVGGTLIKTSNDFIPIEEIKVGDLVWSFNEKTNKIELKKVLSLSQKNAHVIVELDFSNVKIECTEDHPFYINGEWIAAKNLKIEAEVVLFDGSFAKLSGKKFINRDAKVYNFEVEDNHNYFVSERAVLVHNNCDYVSKLFSKNITNETETFAKVLKSLGNSIQNITKNPGLEKIKIPGIDISTLASWNKEQLTAHLGKLMEEGTITKKMVDSFMASFNKAFQNRSTGGNLGKKM
jgi:RHS repeat-associated protein